MKRFGIPVGLTAVICGYVFWAAGINTEAVGAEPDAVGWLCANQDRFTTGLVESQVGFADHRAFTYDQALAVIALTDSGNTKKARKVLRRMKRLQEPGGYWRDAYAADTASVWGWSISTGPTAWMVVAINYYESKTGNRSYASTARAAIGWLEERIDTNTSSDSYGALNLGENISDLPHPEQVFGTEHQFDAYSAFRNRAALTRNAALRSRLTAEAENIMAYLLREVWNGDHFQRGFHDGERWLDCQSWAAMALGVEGPGGEDFVSALDYAYENMAMIMDYNSSVSDVNGFSYNDYEQSVWVEGTLQMADAYRLFADAAKGAYYLGQMERTIRDDGGLPYSFDESGTGEDNWPDNLRYSSVASVAWYYFAAEQVNPFEAAPISVKRCAVRAGKESADSITVSGMIYVTADQLNEAGEVAVGIGEIYSEVIPVSSFLVRGGKYTYKYKIPKGQGGAITSLVINTKTHKFRLRAKRVDLSGLCCPFDFELGAGDYGGVVTVDEDIANGKRFIPIQLMTGIEDYLQVRSVKVKAGRDPNTDWLRIKGGIAFENPPNCMSSLVLTLGGQLFMVSESDFYLSGKNTSKYVCRGAAVLQGGTATATFNFDKCKFTIKIKKSDIATTSGVTALRLAIGNFSQEVAVDLGGG